ncbi:MAG: 6-carboxytetrahydropterin synthase [Bacteroidales bacterium]|jgi:6-pyruvoyltetrahydropterin/6-carboxytetrahydropterin synthase|nr:6-carboxytetrahydropterin synthase [Bacteroidales bacterium]
MTIRVTKQFNFEASHALTDYDGLCSNIHGHSYKLFVSIKGSPSEDKQSPKYGMVVDFSCLKTIVENEILKDFDHALILRNDSLYASKLHNSGTKLLIVNYQPTCENMLQDFVSRLANKLPPETTLTQIKLCETATSYAQWLAEDNALTI